MNFHIEVMAAALLLQHCAIRCWPVCVAGEYKWRVDLPESRTTLVSGATLLLMAERRLPAGLWQEQMGRLV